jgi:hypothetical protein
MGASYADMGICQGGEIRRLLSDDDRVSRTTKIVSFGIESMERAAAFKQRYEAQMA